MIEQPHNLDNEKDLALNNAESNESVKNGRDQENKWIDLPYEAPDNNCEADSYGTSYEKYNGINGWSDDAIDDAFEGDPENTWNVD